MFRSPFRARVLLLAASASLISGGCSGDDDTPSTAVDVAVTGDAQPGADASGAGPDALSDASASLDTTPVGAPPTLGTALTCGQKGAAGGVAAGDGLFRYDVDLDAFPEAVCNDGTGAVMYVRRATSQESAGRWLIRLQGGGGCHNPETCAARWCSRDTNFGMDKMTTSLAPARGIAANGVHARRADNAFAEWNHVYVYYCSSDNWSGQAGAIDATVDDAERGAVDFTIHLNGARIVDAAIASLRRAHDASVTYIDDEDALVELPDLDAATRVVLAGASAGGGGVIRNLDHVAETLAGVEVLGLIDSSWGPRLSTVGLAGTALCLEDGLCDYETFQKSRAAGVNSFWEARLDASCVSWHEADELGSSWRCTDNGEVVAHHLTTPFFLRMGLTDSNNRDAFIDGGFTDPSGAPFDVEGYAAVVRDQLLSLRDAQQDAHEGDAITVAPGFFGPGCPRHETLGHNPSLFETAIATPAGPRTMFDVMGQWLSGSGERGAVADLADLGEGCP